MKVDRRIDKTQNALRLAISSLIEEKPYEQISVKDIVERANVARSSFYAHFRDKDDLVLSGFRMIGINSSDDIFEEGQDTGYPNFAIVLFRGSEQWKSLSRTFLTQKAGTVASHHIRNLLIIQTREWIHRNRTANAAHADLEDIVHYLASALIGLLTWWVNNDFPDSAEVLRDKFNQLAVNGLRSMEEVTIKPYARKP
jgi:AcrR family transcriptional regulator